MRVYARLWRHSAKAWRQLLKKKDRRRLQVAVIIVLSLIMVYTFNRPSDIDPAAYAPLLDTIAKGESGGNYNAYFGSPANDAIRFTDMTVDEVLRWQADHVARGSVSNAVGKYQIIRPTLAGLVKELGMDGKEIFDETLQDRLAIALLKRRGAAEYVNNELTREQFAANLAKEWAALPKATGPNPHESYYTSDRINKSHISLVDVYAALAELQNSTRSGHSYGKSD